MAEVLLPDLGEGIDIVKLSFWHFDVGEEVEEGDDLAEVTTDKATFNIQSTATGVLEEQCFQEGDDIQVGDVMAIVIEQ